MKVAVHYGDHPGTTGAHLGLAAERAGTGAARPHPPRQHARVADERGVEGVLWVESGAISVPVDAHRSPVPTAGYLIDTHLHLPLSLRLAQLFDIVFVAQREDVPRVAGVHPDVHWLPLAAPASFVGLERRPTYPVGFVGNIHNPPQREELLTAVNRVAAMNDWRRRHAVEEMGDVYRSSSLVINPPARNDVNMRFFEAMACGAVVVTPAIDNGLDELARAGEHYVVADFSSGEALAEGVRRALEDDPASMGQRARRLVAGGHTWDHRMATVMGALARASAVAPVRTMTAARRSSLLLNLAASLEDAPLAMAGLRGPSWPQGGVAEVRRALAGGAVGLARDHTPPALRAAYRRGRYRAAAAGRPAGAA